MEECSEPALLLCHEGQHNNNSLSGFFFSFKCREVTLGASHISVVTHPHQSCSEGPGGKTQPGMVWGKLPKSEGKGK